MSLDRDDTGYVLGNDSYKPSAEGFGNPSATRSDRTYRTLLGLGELMISDGWVGRKAVMIQIGE